MRSFKIVSIRCINIKKKLFRCKGVFLVFDTYVLHIFMYFTAISRSPSPFSRFQLLVSSMHFQSPAVRTYSMCFTLEQPYMNPHHHHDYATHGRERCVTQVSAPCVFDPAGSLRRSSQQRTPSSPR